MFVDSEEKGCVGVLVFALALTMTFVSLQMYQCLLQNTEVVFVRTLQEIHLTSIFSESIRLLALLRDTAV